ncbi:uncharacterized protein TRIADDRAFT_51560 [Trichoplax adhaerens]|uniref:Protein kinase domain-containing protein n=1 Tax=Trichoplax adhaerens TaxID=10228 RepID=B3RJR6_TRIAD|nr:hypothetical protein TRIADDRAFT_51560 [Trichoplax adhaerens]EDV28546.1 hypothetical protein TRIADDRAFT_51560 [Trichoplax adhaerens]|eukprot:XP_002107748.1 hypothetical protein TRIADDRAFT_51560 [Trichoplax adhaerens]
MATSLSSELKKIYYQHPNLVRFHTALVVDKHLCIVMELVANGSLRIMLKNEGGNLDYKIRLNICKGIAKGINYLHTAYSTHLVHRDIKTDNVLLTEDYTAKICDFGLGKILCQKFNSETVITSHICGTEAYLPPEALQGKVSRRLDIYSYGVVLLEILSGKSPLYNGSEKCRFLVGLFHLHYNHNRTAFPIDETANWPNDYKRGLMELAKWCLKTKYRKRPLMNQVGSKNSLIIIRNNFPCCASYIIKALILHLPR